MCGFAGFYNIARSDFSVDEQLLNCMQQCIAHRGPDAAGIWKSDTYQLGLAARRLKIVDLSDAGNQPLYDQQNNIILCFNGEIYNYRQLRTELERYGYYQQSSSDTQTIINAYKAWGIQALSHLHGMFAIVLFDIENRKLFLIRDRIGVKPLYFSLQGGVISFASEIKALWQLPWMEKHINVLAWYHYLTFMVAPAPWTMFDGVYKLPAGFYIEVDQQKQIHFNQWYTPLRSVLLQDKKIYASEHEVVEHIRHLLIQSTQKRMVADVPVGAYLSGGLDSSLNVALMSRFAKHVKTFTIAFTDDAAHNERAWAQKVANQFGTEHHELEIGEKEAFNFYERMVYQLDEPLADCVCIPFYYVSVLAHQVGMKVVQVGEGADELFFGYPSYVRFLQSFRIANKCNHLFMPAIAKKGLLCASQFLFTGQPLKKELLSNIATGRVPFWGGALAFGELQKTYIKKCYEQQLRKDDPVVSRIYPGMQQMLDSYSIINYHLSQLKEINPDASFGTQMLYIELKQRLPELLLMRADKMSMATSIEAREPYLDHELVEFMLYVPDHLRFKNNTTKYLLKKVAEGILPHEVIYRDKVGFGAPTFAWLEQGNYFPAYFAKQETQGHHHFGSRRVDDAENKSNLHRAVQNWTLQQLWTFMQQQGLV